MAIRMRTCSRDVEVPARPHSLAQHFRQATFDAAPEMSSGGAKRHLFQLTTEETSDSSVLVGYAQRLPMPQKSSDEFEEGESRMQREHFQKIINMVWRNPKVVAQAASTIENMVKKLHSMQGAGYFNCVSILRSLDDDWACDVLVIESKISADKMESATRFDPDAWRQVMSYALKASPTLKIPKVCRDKAILRRALRKRIADIGDSLQKIDPGEFLSEATGGINWLKIGVYEATFGENGRLASVLHRPSNIRATVATYVYVDKGFKLENNWCDATAVFVRPPAARIVCADLFEQGQGPNVAPILTGASKAFDAIVSEAASHREEQMRQEQVDRGEGSV